MSIESSCDAKWKLKTAGQQQEMYQLFGDREFDLVSRNERDTLKTKLSKAIFSTDYEDCKYDQRESVNKTLSKLLEISGSSTDIHLGYVFVCVRSKDAPHNEGIVPIIRTKKRYSDRMLFVEAQPGRIYEGWNDYEENNRLPQCDMCYPSEGVYRLNWNSKILELKYRESPSCEIGFKVLDVVSGIGGLASAGVLTASIFFPLAMPFVLGAGILFGSTTAYSTGRTIYNLVDLNDHGESIALDNPEALATWIQLGAGIVGAVLGGGTAIIPRLVAAGKITASMSTTIIELLSWVSHAFNGFGIISVTIGLILKCKDGTLTLADLQHFMGTCLFVGNLMINRIIAERLIQMLSAQPALMKNAFNMVRNGVFTVTKTVIDGVTTCFDTIVQLILGGCVTPILRFCNMNSTAHVIDNACVVYRKVQTGKINTTMAVVELHRIFSPHLGKFLKEINYAVTTIAECFGISFDQIEIDGRSVFRDHRLSSQSPRVEAVKIMDNVNTVVDTMNVDNMWTRESCNKDILQMVMTYAKRIRCFDAREFNDVATFVLKKFNTEFERQLMVEQSNTSDPLNGGDKTRILSNLRRYYMCEGTIQSLMKEYESNRPNYPVQSTLGSQIYVTPKGEKRGFVANYDFFKFNEYIIDMACELLRCKNIFDQTTTFELDESELAFSVQRGSSYVFFTWTLDEFKERAFGIAVLNKQTAS